MPPPSIPPRCCAVCNASLAGKRADAKFCSERCRQAHQRGKTVGFRPVRETVKIDASLRDRLVEAGHLAQWDEADRDAIARAFRALVSTALGD